MCWKGQKKAPAIARVYSEKEVVNFKFNIFAKTITFFMNNNFYVPEKDHQQEFAQLLTWFLHIKKEISGKEYEISQVPSIKPASDNEEIVWATIEFAQRVRTKINELGWQLHSLKERKAKMEDEIKNLIPRQLHGQRLKIHHKLSHQDSRKIYLFIPEDEDGPIEVTTDQEL